MAKVDTEDLAAQAAKRAEFRLHHVGTKLNERELGALEGLLGKRTPEATGCPILMDACVIG